MLKKIKLNDDNKENKEFIASIEISNRLIDELSEISLQIEEKRYSKDFSYLLNKIEDSSKDNKIISDHRKIMDNYIDEIFLQLKSLKQEEHSKNIQYLGDSIDRAVEISKNHENFKEARELLKGIQKEFSQKYINPDSHEFLWSTLQDSFSRLKKREKIFFDNKKKLWKKNYDKIAPEVSATIELIKEDANFKEVWNSLITLQKKFKGLKLEKAKQQELWDKLQNGFELLKELQEKYNEAHKEDWEKNFGLVSKKLEEVSEFVENSTNFKNAWKELKEFQHFIDSNPIGKENNDLIKKRLQTVFDSLKKRQQIRNEEIAKLKDGGFDKLNRLTNRAINEATTNKDLDDVFKKLKMWQQDIFKAFYITKEEKDLLLGKINDAFAIFQGRKKELSKKKREEWLQKQEDFLKKITERKERLESHVIPNITKSIKDSLEYIAKLEQEITEDETKKERLENKIVSVKEQIEEKKQNKVELLEKIVELTSLIEDVNSKLQKK